MWTPATDHQWIDAVCRQLTRVTGWPTVFAPTPPEEALPVGRARSGAFSWKCDVNDGEKTVGTLSVVLPAGRALSDSFLRACESADLIAQLVQRVLLEQSAADGLRTARPATSRSPASVNPADADPWTRAVNRILDVALRLTSLRGAVLFVADPQHECLRRRALWTHDRQAELSFPRPLNEAPFDLPSIPHAAVVIRRSARRYSEWLPEGISLGVCYGIRTNGRPRGTLWVFDRRDRRLTPREEQVLESIVMRLGDLIEKAVLLEESTLQRQLRAELRIASEAQAAQPVSRDELDGWCHITGRMESVREVGGDLCEVIPLDDDRLLLAIGDAAGHSIPAALIMTTVRGALRVIADESRTEAMQPEQILMRVNRVLYGVVEPYQFMTLACALLDRGEQSMRLANAGHPPPLLIRDGDVRALEDAGLLLGVTADAEYESHGWDLKEGDVLVFYTDGISEARGKDRQLFRSTGISDVVRQHADKPPDEIVSHVWEALDSHLAADEHDDRTLLVVRVAPCDSRTSVVGERGSQAEGLVRAHAVAKDRALRL